MSKNFPPDLQEKMTVFCNEILEQMAGNHTKNHEEFLSQWQKLHTLYLTSTAELLQEWTEKYDTQHLEELKFPDKIEAHSVVIEIMDHNTGKLFRRDLPLEYIETDNGIRLSGETIDGTATQIVFFSDTAMDKIRDLTGMGPDAPRCNHDD